MARPLKIKYVSTVFDGIQEMTDAEINYIAYQVCQAVASKTSNTGNLTLNVNGATGSTIGTFVDTNRNQAIGTHPASTSITSTTYTFKQNLNTETSSPVRPLEYSTNALREMADSEIQTYVYSKVNAYLAAGNAGAYYLQPTTPTPTGTWVSVATITDSAVSGDANTYLWRNTTGSSPTAVRPLRVFGTDMKEMSDAEMQSLFEGYANYVVGTGPGQYLAQSATPTPGTWVRMGSQFDDTRQTASNASYTGTYATSYSAAYAGSRELGYAGSRQNTYAGSRNKTYSRSYSGFTRANYTGTYSASYTGTYSTTYTGTYASSYGISYAGSRENTYVGLTINASKETVSNVSLWFRTA